MPITTNAVTADWGWAAIADTFDDLQIGSPWTSWG